MSFNIVNPVPPSNAALQTADYCMNVAAQENWDEVDVYDVGQFAGISSATGLYCVDTETRGADARVLQKEVKECLKGNGVKTGKGKGDCKPIFYY